MRGVRRQQYTLIAGDHGHGRENVHGLSPGDARNQFQGQAGDLALRQSLRELRVGQRVGHADKELTGFQLVQIFLAIGRIAARSLNLQDCLSVGKDVVPVGEFRAGVFIVAVGKPGRLASAAFDADLDTVFLEQCTDVGGRQCDALFAGANFLGYTDNHLRYPHFMVRKNRSI